MSDLINKENDITAIADDQLDSVAGGFFFQKCSYGGFFQAQFPEKRCKNCPHFTKEKFENGEAKKKYRFKCAEFSCWDWKNVDLWGFF